MDFVILAIFPWVSTIFVEIFKLSILPATLLYFGIPAAFLSWRKPSLIRKSLLFSLSFSITALFVLDYPAFLDNIWYVPNSLFRFLNSGIPIEDGIWMILWVYFVVICWEYFLDKDKNKTYFDKNTKYLLLTLGGLLTLFFASFVFAPQYLHQNYFFLKLGIIFEIIPMVIVLVKFPRLIPKVIMLGAYFLMTAYLIERSGLKFGHWYYGGQHYLGTVQLLGNRLPWEEIVFFWCLGASAVICWYEFFVDDRK